MHLSVIIPTLNEAKSIAATVLAARQPGVEEILVVDGGSADDTVAVAGEIADRVIVSGRGRAAQMNAGASRAAGDVLLFLHADTIVPKGFAAAVESALADDAVIGGRFDVRLDPSSPLLWLTGTLINVRSRTSKVSTGDQAMFIRRAAFEHLGGFPDLPLMEDLALSRAMKAAGRIACLREQVVTSSRRWVKGGVVRTIALMWTLRLLYYAGIPPERLRRWYADMR